MAATVAAGFADVEVVDVQVRGGHAATLTVFIDRPGGVDFELCGAVTRALDDLRDAYALEVSSPGLERPLRRVEHFARAVGQRVYIKTSAPRAGRSVFRGVLRAVDAGLLTLALDEGETVAIPVDVVAKAHVIIDFEDNGGRCE